MATTFFKVLHKYSAPNKCWVFVICNQRFCNYKMGDFIDTTNQAGHTVSDVLEKQIPRMIKRLRLHGKVAIKRFLVEIIDDK